MKISTTSNRRIHSLDAIRAVMMLLGLVLHSALTYNVTNHGDAWNLKDPNTQHIGTDVIVLFIHSFRMPIFFLIAGYFGALLFYERGARPMIMNRLKRIILPFVVFLILLTPLVIWTFSYTKFVFSGVLHAFDKSMILLSSIQTYIPQGTMHLWFLYYLIYITVFTAFVALIIKKHKPLTQGINSVFLGVMNSKMGRIAAFCVVNIVLLSSFGVSMINSPVSLIPELATFTYYLLFYLVGWLIYTSKYDFNDLIPFSWLITLIAFCLVFVKAIYIKETGILPESNAVVLIVLSSVIVWLFTFGLIGLFVKYVPNYSLMMRYCSEASYWVYLIHLPFVALLPAFLMGVALPAFVKFFIVLVATSFICFTTYHYLVRSSFIGKFLNGRTY